MTDMEIKEFSPSGYITPRKKEHNKCKREIFYCKRFDKKNF